MEKVCSKKLIYDSFFFHSPELLSNLTTLLSYRFTLITVNHVKHRARITNFEGHLFLRPKHKGTQQKLRFKFYRCRLFSIVLATIVAEPVWWQCILAHTVKASDQLNQGICLHYSRIIPNNLQIIQFNQLWQIWLCLLYHYYSNLYGGCLGSSYLNFKYILDRRQLNKGIVVFCAQLNVAHISVAAYQWIS